MNELNFPFDNSYILRNKKNIKKQLKAMECTRNKIKIAVLTGSTVNDIVSVLELFLLDLGFEPDFYISEYNQFKEDALFGNQELDSFAPDLIYIHTTYRNISAFKSENFSLSDEFNDYKNIWQTLFTKFKCPIIQNNFDLPLCRAMGNADCWHSKGKANFINRLNSLFSDYASENENFFINDINYISACFGLEKWHDNRYWYMYKYAMNLDAVPNISYSISCIIKSLYGKNKKLIALDLDNTLWGGVIGDDGQEGIEIGAETAGGESFTDFQKFISEYKKNGVLLGVCSKNDYENAILGLNHPESTLAPKDFVNIKANWSQKDLNLEDMANELSLLTDSFVFIDDNPVECNIVKSQLPTVTTINFDTVPEAMYQLSRGAYFEVTRLSDDDIKRNEMYATNAQRSQHQKSFANYSDYLQSLDMTAIIEDFQPVYLQRITQLTNKSNQFNLTTKRYSDLEMQNVFNSQNHIRLYGKLIDKFGDNGIVSVIIGEKSENILNIDLWIMSCRVLKRDMEFAMLDALVQECQKSNIDTIVGYYYKTSKNNMVANLYKDFGFKNIKSFANEDTVWELKLNSYKQKNNVIKVKESEKI